MTQSSQNTAVRDGDIAIVGMSCRFPGAAGHEAYWQNLRNGVESITRLDEATLRDSGEPAHVINHPDYVPHAAVLDRFEYFDAEFFGFSPKEAAIMDPQHRLFLEASWEALENSGHPPEKFPGPVGVYAGCGMGSYFYFNLCSNPELVSDVGMFLLRHTGNDKDFLATRLSHVLDLRGPSVNIQTACSTSLVATHYACQALLTGECDMALAGGVTVELPHARGYLFKEGEILSPDGHCHAFDHRAEGTVFGSGTGVVVLRRLSDAIADRDHIWAVIRGSAINNDGAEKAGYLAPSVEGQARAVADALHMAEANAETISYVECHGTGTYLGDPIEVEALSQAFSESTDKSGFCRIGSVKTNIGHLDTAAGAASLIKTALSLHHRELPPSLGYEKPNPAIDFETSPFRVNNELTRWDGGATPLRAGVNSLGVGGTNAHIILEEAPRQPASDASDWPFQLLTISGRSKAALDANAKALADHLRSHPEQPLADIAWTLKEGRREFEKRRVVVAETHEEAANLLEENDPRRVFTHSVLGDAPEVAFMFPGGGAQYAGMARDLYETEPVFADWMDRGFAVLSPRIDYDLRALWLIEDGDADAANQRLQQPSIQLPLIMIVEYALAQLWISWGIKPAALVGHSMGENTAACLAGVLSFEDCIGLVHLRGRLFDTVPAGGMLSVALPAEELRTHLGDDLDLAAVNAPLLSVATGPQAALDALAKKLGALDVDCQRIPIDIAAHSRMLEPILDDFRSYLRSIELSPPQIPFVSNRSGQWITNEEATDPDYWVSHLRGTVQFSDCIGTLAETHGRLLIEVGPGKALSSLATQHPAVSPDQVLGSLRHPDDTTADDAYFLAMLGRVWAAGGTFDWQQIWGDAQRNRVVLPTYRFQQSPYFIEPGTALAQSADEWLTRIAPAEERGWKPVWVPKYAACEFDVEADLTTAPKERWLIFADDAGLCDRLGTQLKNAGQEVTFVTPGDRFARLSSGDYQLPPERGREPYDRLVADLLHRDQFPTRIVHGWLVTRDNTARPGSSYFHRVQEQGFYSLLFFTQAFANEDMPTPPHMTILTSGSMQVRDEALLFPEKSTVLGPARLIPREINGVTANLVDIDLPLNTGRSDAASHRDKRNQLVPLLLEELLAEPGNAIAALRNGRRYEQTFRPHELVASEHADLPLTDRGTYLITGGFGGIGLTLAAALVARCNARIVLLSRTELPPRARWDSLVRTAPNHDKMARRIRAIRDIEAAGGEVLCLVADVSNIEEMQQVRQTIETRFGRVSGVIHAAGLIDDAPLLTKTTFDIENVMAPKVHGTNVLDQVFADGDLDWLALFSSTSTITAPVGQIDYVAANEFLNAYAKARAADKTQVFAINWGIWADAGMALEAMEERLSTTSDPERLPPGTPLLETIGYDELKNRQFTANYAANTHWVFDEHRIATGTALMPGTGYIELVAEALHAQGESTAFEIRNLYFLRPLSVSETTPIPVQVNLPRTNAGYDFEVQSTDDSGSSTNAEAEIVLLPVPAKPALDLVAIASRCGAPDTPEGDGTLASVQEKHLRFGPRWQVLKSAALGAGEGLAYLALPESARRDLEQGFQLHPALLDIATGWAMKLIDGYDGANLWVPATYQSISVYRSLPDRIASWVRLPKATHANDATARFDITITDMDGNICMDIHGFVIRRMDTVTDFAAPKVTSISPSTLGKQATRPLSPAEERLRHNLSQGIRTDEGPELFFRAMATGLPQVVVSSLDLDGLMAQAAENQRESSGLDQKFERPELDSNFTPPETEGEKRLALIWQDLLGISEIGIDDSFFDLGGHSLIAVRLFAQVQKIFQVELPISVLFEAPTIRKCAALIEAEGGVTDAATNDGLNQPDGKAVAAPARRFTHLVPMHSGEGGPKTPFFLVAGMFGNVLNLRHLAQLIGTERPFYGLQAKGLYGDAEPHNSLVDAAASCIEEIRQVQPHGPYMVGGFSGGGLTALEIARQLRANGEEVSALIMLDTPLPQQPALSLRDRLMIHWLELRAKGLAYPVTWLKNRREWKRKLQERHENDIANDDTHFHDAEIEGAFLESIAKYELQVWDGPLVLFRPPLSGRWQVAKDRMVNDERDYIYSDNDWTRWAPAVEVFEVPGDHDSMVLVPNVRVLAKHMREIILAAEKNNQIDTLTAPYDSGQRAAE